MTNWTKEQTSAINEKGKNIIVSAGAGSGKTAVLTERVVTHLKNKIGIEHLLILTFTNAAAAEMKERIRKKIKAIPELKEQLDKIDTASITTFDAYALSLVKKYSHILNISSDIKIAESSFLDLKKEKILTEIFNEYYEEKNNLFLKLIDDFSLKDDKEIFTNILSLNNQISNLYNKKDYLKKYVEENYKDERINIYLDEYLKYLKEKKKEIKNIIARLSLYQDGTYIEKIENVLHSFLLSENYIDIKNNITTELPRLPSGSDEESKTIKKELSKVLKEFEELTKYESIDKIKETLLKTQEYAKIITEILLKLDERLDDYKKQNNLYEFIDISNMAINLLKEHAKVRENLKEKYYEILIDEYQDTNDLQELFVSLIEKNNVYMVGDIKQSIYRFRNTNPKLFKDKYNLYSQNEKGLKIDLNRNFRSRNQVLSSINKLFDHIMNEEIGGAEYRQSHRMIFGNNSYDNVSKENYDLEILNYKDDENYSKEEIEIFTIANDIKNKVNNDYEIMDSEGKPRKVKYKDFAILMDRSSSFEKYKQIFEYLNIPLNIYRDKAITDSKDILIIKNLYKLIIDIHSKNFKEDFKYAFMSVSRSFLLETKDNEIFDHLNDFKHTNLYQKCLKLSENILEITNYDLINKIINEFNLYEKIIKDGNIHEHIVIIDSLKKIAQNLDDLGYSPFEFLEYLEEVLEKGLDIKLKINKGSSDAVKIMTIHASKGLEFPICYYSGLSKKFNIDDLKSKFYFNEKYGIITPYIDNEPKTTILKTLLKKDYLKEEISEKLRLFYVALTRAREKIIIVTSLNPINFDGKNVIDDSIRLKYLSFKDIIDSASTILEDHIKNIDNQKLNLTKNYNLSKKHFNKDKFLKRNPIKIEEIKLETKEIKDKHFSKKIHKLRTENQTKNVKEGLHMHEIFENFDFKNPDYSSLTSFETSKVKAFINTNILEKAKDIYKEYEFIYEYNDIKYHGIIDLLLIKDNENIIIDYKLKDIQDEEYIKQLNGYKKYIEDITNKETKIYLYSILDEKLTQI